MLPALRCPIIVGRDHEVQRLLARADAAVAGRGGVVAVVGDAGAGKSRLVREVVAHAQQVGMRVLRGRAVDSETSAPYRPVAEALLGALREGQPPEAVELRGFEHHLGRLLPAWRQAPTPSREPEASSVLVSEGVVRLLRVLAGTSGALVVFEDVHWADAESLAVIDYLLDALPSERICCIVTSRPDVRADGPAAGIIARIRRHVDAQVIQLGPLDDRHVTDMVTATLDVTSAPQVVVDFVNRHSDGTPLLVEELLAGLAGSGAITFDGGWVVTGELTPTVPSDMADSVRARLAALPPAARRVLGGAAVLGRHFDWNLLPAVGQVDAHAVVEALRAAVAAGLVEVDGQGFRFRHALLREVVLADLLPPERQQLAARAWPAIELAHPGLPGSWCELAAELAEAAGEPAAAAARLVESARRALEAGALSSAEATVRRARRLAGDDPVGVDAAECFVEVLSLAGKPQEAMEVGLSLTDRMAGDGTGAARRVAVLTMTARAGVAAGSLEVAAACVDRARALVDEMSLDDARAPVGAVAAHVALDLGDDDAAEALARSAVDLALGRGQAAVACEALEVIGRVARSRPGGDVSTAFERAATIAERHGLTGWLLRARHELALDRVADGDVSVLREHRELAARHGALVRVAVMDLVLADMALAAMDRVAARVHAEECVAASRRYGLATLPVAELWLAGAHALEGDDAAMAEAERRALERDPDDARILGDLWGRVRALRSLLRDDREQLREDLEQMMEHVDRAPPGTSVFSGRLIWVVLRTLGDDDLGAAAQERMRSLAQLSWFTAQWQVLEMARAISLGRQGRSEEATALLARTLEESRRTELAAFGTSRYIHLLTGEAQIRDGWGDPVALLRPAEAFFAERGYDRVARRCRLALGAAGAPMPRRGRGESEVPERLRAAGITGREHDVLLLVVQGRSNRQVADALHLSPKTVERHISNLFVRTGVRRRADLAAWVDDDAN